MATEEEELQATSDQDLRGNGRRPGGAARPSLLQQLWADLRGKKLDRPADPVEIEWQEEEEELRRAYEEEVAKGRSISPDRLDAMRRRYARGGE